MGTLATREAQDVEMAALSETNKRLGLAFGLAGEKVLELSRALDIANARVTSLSQQVRKLWRGLGDVRIESAAWLGERDARIQVLEQQLVKARWDSCPLVGLDARVAIEEGGALADALEVWYVSLTGERKSLTDCIREKQVVASLRGGGWICQHGNSMLILTVRDVVVVPDGDFKFGVGEDGSMKVEYGNPSTAITIEEDHMELVENMFPVAAQRWLDEVL